MCSDTTTATATNSPRNISYSSLDKFGQVGGIPLRLQSHPSLAFADDSGFEFGVFHQRSLEHELSSADQLFWNGTILPLSINSSQQPLPFLSPLYSSPPPLNNGKKTTTKHILDSTSSGRDRDQEKLHRSKSSSSSFWGFRRSNSVNNSGCSNNLSLLFPIPVLPRSRSVSSNKLLRPLFNFNCNKQQESSCAVCPQRSSSATLMRKSRSGGGGGGSYNIRVTPVLHVTAPCISKGCFSLGIRGKKNIAAASHEGS